MPLPTPQPPSAEQEKHTLQQALVECRRRLEILRAEGDELAANLAESDLNVMLERLGELSQ